MCKLSLQGFHCIISFILLVTLRCGYDYSPVLLMLIASFLNFKVTQVACGRVKIDSHDHYVILTLDKAIRSEGFGTSSSLINMRLNRNYHRQEMYKKMD